MGVAACVLSIFYPSNFCIIMFGFISNSCLRLLCANIILCLVNTLLSSEYGSSKTAFSYPFSIDNKARYCALHQYDLNVDLHTSGFTMDGDASEGSSSSSAHDASWRHATRSSRFRKLQLIREMWDAYVWLVWMDLDALFVDPHTDVLDLLDKVRCHVRILNSVAHLRCTLH